MQKSPHIKSHNMCEKEVKINKCSVCAYNSQDFEQTHENFARAHNCETMTFRNSDVGCHMSRFFFLFFSLDKVVELVGAVFVINRAYPV